MQRHNVNHETWEWKHLKNHHLVLQHLEKVISTIKIPYCNNLNIRTPFLQHMKSPIATYENHLLQHPKIPLTTQRNSKAYKTARHYGIREVCRVPGALGKARKTLGNLFAECCTQQPTHDKDLSANILCRVFFVGHSSNTLPSAKKHSANIFF